MDLLCGSDLKGKFEAAGLDMFYQNLLPGYPNGPHYKAIVHVCNQMSLWADFLCNEHY